MGSLIPFVQLFWAHHLLSLVEKPDRAGHGILSKCRHKAPHVNKKYSSHPFSHKKCRPTRSLSHLLAIVQGGLVHAAGSTTHYLFNIFLYLNTNAVQSPARTSTTVFFIRVRQLIVDSFGQGREGKGWTCSTIR